MKKTLIILSIALAGVACTRESVLQAPRVETVFSAHFSEAAGKTALDGTKVLWGPSDEISILWDGGSATAQAETPGVTTNFTAAVESAAAYYAVYPSSVSAAVSGDALTLTIPSAQHGGFAEANIAVAKTAADELGFKNVCALGCLFLDRADVAEVRISGNGNESICGETTLSLDSEGIPTCGGSPAGKEIVLTPASGSAFAIGAYYFAVIPGALESGLSISLTTSGGEALQGKTSSKRADFVRSHVLNLGTVASSPAPAPVYTADLFFDFTVDGLGWPTSKEDSWAGLKNFDSGCAADNGGTATDNPHRRAQVTYTLSGTDYDFTFADPDEATSHNIYLSTGKGVYSGTLRAFGLPALAGKKLAKVEMVQNASTKTTAGWYRNVGITAQVYHKDVAAANMSYVSGGEPQNQNTNGATYTYELSGTEANTVYWLNSPTNASIIKSLRLYYVDADASMAPPIPSIDLSFSFTGEPFAGWPTAKSYPHVDGGISCIYPLNGTCYVFVPADCDTASSGNAFWQAPTGGNPGYFALNAQYRYLGLPRLAGYALTKVVCHNVKLSSTAPKVGITTLIASSAAHPAASAYVSGGETQTWDANGGQIYTYNLSGTQANTRYYIYGYAKGAISSIDLTYTRVTQ